MTFFNKQEDFKINYGHHTLTKLKLKLNLNLKESRDLEWE